MGNQQHKHAAKGKPQQRSEQKPERKPKTNWLDGVVLLAMVTTLSGIAIANQVGGDDPSVGAPATQSAITATTDTLKAHAEKIFKAGLNALELGNVGQAIGHFEDALKLDSNHSDARKKLAEALQAKRDLDRENLQKSTQTRGNDWRWTGIVAAIITALGIVIVAVITTRKRSSAPVQTVATTQTMNVGLDSKDVGDELKGAVDPLTHAVASVSDEVKAMRAQLAEAQLAPEQPVPDSAAPLKVKAVEFYNAGVDAQKRGEIGQAIGHNLDALALDPDDAGAHNNLGVLLIAKGDLDGAIERYNEAVRIDPDHAMPHNNLGNALLVKGDLDGAIEHWTEALRIDPDRANTHYNLGNAFKAKGDLDGAIEHYSEALRIEPGFAEAHNNLGHALDDKGDYDGAIEHYNEALRIEPDSAAAHNNLGVALAGKGDLDGAIEHSREAIRINPKEAMYYSNLASALARKKATAEAVGALTKAIELDERYRAWAKTDEDYDGIRNDPGFRKLVYGE